MICSICGRKLSQEGSRVMEKNEIKDIGTAVCPVCGGEVIQRKSIATCATIRRPLRRESEWQCIQCEMNFSAEMTDRHAFSREVNHEQELNTWIDILGNVELKR